MTRFVTLSMIVVASGSGCESPIRTAVDEVPTTATAQVLDDSAYWELREPYDKYLPDSIPEAEVQAELAVMQKRFRTAMSELGVEDRDWELPRHYQHVRVFTHTCTHGTFTRRN